jgi:hypothetical protein
MTSPLSPSHKKGAPSLGQTFGTAGKKGEEGERLYETSLRTFVTTISTLQPPRSYSIFHSLNIPVSVHHQKFFVGDVDFAIASGNRLVLIDVKLWQPGFYWSLKLPSRDSIDLLGDRKNTDAAQWLRRRVFGRRLGLRALSAHVDGKWFLSHNMEIALERYRARLEKHGVHVTAAVVFISGPRVTGVQNVALLRWPGDIRSYTSADSFTELHHRLGNPAPLHPAITSLLSDMKRR